MYCVPDYDFYHCLQCHENIQTPSNVANLGKVLKQHYSRSNNHSINEPPRYFVPASYEEMSESDKKVVSEGM
jgi:hypothetical protein